MLPIRYEGHHTMSSPDQPGGQAAGEARQRQENREGEYAAAPGQYETLTGEKVGQGDEVKGHLAAGEAPETMEYGVTDSPGAPEQAGAREMPAPEEASGVPESQQAGDGQQ